MQGVNAVPVKNSEEAQWIEDGRLTNGAPCLTRSHFKLKPCATGNFHFGAEPQTTILLDRFNPPEIESVPDSQSILITPSASHSHTTKQQVNETADRPQPVSVIPPRATADAALSIAKFTASDEFAGLADEKLLAKNIPDLDLFHPWDLPVERAIELAQACENAAFAVDKRITNSEGATVSLQQSHFAYGNSLGFLGGYPSSRHWISCAVIAGKGDAMQRDDWYTSARDPAALDAPEAVGKIAGARALARVGAKKIVTAQVPVLFEAPVAASLLGHFVSAVSGGSLYRKSSFLVDSLGKKVFSPLVDISEDPLIAKGEASSPFDEEGVATHRRQLVEQGVVQ